MQYDRRLDWHLGVCAWMWNIGSLCGKGELCEELRKRMCVVFSKLDGEDRVLGCLGWRYSDISCGGMEEGMDLMLWVLW